MRMKGLAKGVAFEINNTCIMDKRSKLVVLEKCMII